MKIRFKLFLLFLIVTVIPLFFISIIVYYNAENYLAESILKNLNSAADSKINKIETVFNALKNSLETVQGYYNVRKNLPIITRFFNDKTNQEYVTAKEQLDSQIAALQNVKEFENVLFINASGKVVFCSNPEHNRTYLGSFINNISPGIFESAKSGIYFSDHHKHGNETDEYLKNELALLAAAPMHDFEGKFIGEVIFELDLKPIFDQFNKNIGKTKETVIGKKINDKEIIIINNLRFDGNGALSKKILIGDKFSIPIQNAVSGETGSGIAIDYRGVEVLADWHYLPYLNWGIVSKIDTKEVLSPINNLKNIVILLVLICFFAVLLIVLAISKSISDPIEQLRKGTEIIATGNLNYRVDISTGDEIGQLSRAFNKMSENLGDLQGKYAELIQTTPLCVKVFDSKGNLLFINKGGRDEHFLTDSDDISKWDWLGTVEKKYHKAVNEKFDAALKGESGSIEFEHVPGSSKFKWCSSSFSPIKGSDGKVKEILIFSSDITALKDVEFQLEQKVEKRTRDLQKANRALVTISEANRVAIKATDEMKLLKNVCEVLIKNAGYRMVWVGYKEENENKDVRVVASAGYDEGYLDKVNVTWANVERGKGPTGTAIREGRMISFPDFEKEVAFKPWLKDALKRGYKSSIVFPIFVNQEVIGAISIYASEVNIFTQDEIKILEELSSDLSFSIESIRNNLEKEKVEGELRDSEERYRNLIELSPDAVVVHSGQKIIFANNATVKLLGAHSVDEIIGKNTLDFVHPDSLELVKKRIAKMITIGENVPMEDEKFVRLDGVVIDVEVIAAPIIYQEKKAIQVIIHDITERKRAEEIVKISEQKFRAIFDNANDGIILADMKTKKFYEGNMTFNRMVGYNNDEIKTLGVLDIHPKKDLSYVIDQFDRQSKKEFELAENIPVKRKDGSVFYADINSTPVNIGGKEYLMGIFRDITERKLVEESLRKNEERLRLEINRMPIGYIIWDKDFHVITWNPAAEKIFGFTFDEAKGRHPYDIIVPHEAQPKVDDIWQRLLLGDISANSVNENTTRDGRTIMCEWTNTPLKQPDGTILGVMSMVQDITERKKAEESLRERTEDLQKFKLAVESTDNHVIITDPNGIILYANKAAEKITGYSISEMLGGRPSLWGNQMGKEFYKKMWHVIKEKKNTFIGEVNNKRKNGQEYFAEIHISPILDENNNIKFFVGVERDITEEKKMDQTKNEFVSIASHQLRTPMTGIKWVIERFLKTENLTAKGKEYLEDIHVSMERLSMLVNDLLNFSRIEEKTIKVSVTKFDLNDFVKNNLKEWAALFEKKKIENEFMNFPGDSMIETDINILGNILQCLVSNAIEYTPENGKVGIFVRKKEKTYVIEVNDTGIGIPKSEQDKMFKKFIRASNAKLVKPDGTGIGLYIAKQSAALLGGEVYFESEENVGSTFYVELPCI